MGSSFVVPSTRSQPVAGPGVSRSTSNTGSSAAPGLNDYIDAEQPFWAGDPELLALQLEPALGRHEERAVEFEGSEAPAITVTTTGLLDDSVDGTQLVVTTSAQTTGSSVSCQPPTDSVRAGPTVIRTSPSSPVSELRRRQMADAVRRP